MYRNSRGIDSQRSRLYKAENVAFTALQAQMRDVSTPELYQRRVDEIMGSRYVARLFPRAAGHRVNVEYVPQMRGANANDKRIRTGKFGLREWYLIHELCHVIVRRQYPTTVKRGDDGRDYQMHQSVPTGVSYNLHVIVGHGPEYADVYLRMVRRFLGVAAYDALRAAFKQYRVRSGMRPRRAPSAQPTMTPEQRATSLAKAHAAVRERAAAKLWEQVRDRGIEFNVSPREWVSVDMVPAIGPTTHVEISRRWASTFRIPIEHVNPMVLWQLVRDIKAGALNQSAGLSVSKYIEVVK